MAYCTNCGRKLRDEDKFCAYCGEPVEKTDENPNTGKRNLLLIAGAAIGILLLILIVVIVVIFNKSESEDAGNGSYEGSLESSQAPIGTEDGTKDSLEDSQPSVDTDAMIADIIGQIEAQPEYVSESFWEPLAAADDFNGDGVEEFLCVYEQKSGAGFEVMYEVWSLKASGAEKIKSETLFLEVGGNNGIVGIVNAGQKAYLAVYRYEPEGDQFNDYYIYFPWDGAESRLGDSAVYLESHGVYGQEEEGRYIMGDTTVDKDSFEERYQEFDNWVYRLELVAGAGEDGVKSFEDMKK